MAETLRNAAWVAENERLNAEMQRRRFRVVVIVEECVAGDGEDSGDWEENTDLADTMAYFETEQSAANLVSTLRNEMDNHPAWRREEDGNDGC